MILLAINTTIIISGIVVFLLVTLILVGILLYAKAKLTAKGDVQISINNGERVITTEPGNSLLSTLSSQKIFLPSACGGKGSCGMCRCQVDSGAGSILNLQGWTWEAMSEYTLKCTKKTLSASRLAVMLCQACDELYEERPGDDTTVAVARVIERRVVSIFTGPPARKEDDVRIMHDFMNGEGKKVVSGGTSANIAARILKKKIVTKADTGNPDVPPMAVIEGIDLVTEGVLTLGKCLKLLRKYVRGEFDTEFFDDLDADNGASRLARLLIEECTELHLFVGTAVNEAHKETELNFDLSMRQNLVDQLVRTAEEMDKRVTVKYY